MKKNNIVNVDKKLIEEIYKSFEGAKNTNGKVYSLLIDGVDNNEKTNVLLNLKEYNDKRKKYNCAYYDVSQNAMFSLPLIPILYSFNKAIKNGKASKLSIKFINQMTKLLGSTNGFSSVFTKKTNVFKELDSFYEEFGKLKQLITKIVGKKKFIILVDKLDICSADYQYKVLEALYSLFEYTNTLVVLSYDKSKSTSNTKEIFDDEVDDSFNIDEFKKPHKVNEIGEGYKKSKKEMKEEKAKQEVKLEEKKPEVKEAPVEAKEEPKKETECLEDACPINFDQKEE